MKKGFLWGLVCVLLMAPTAGYRQIERLEVGGGYGSTGSKFDDSGNAFFDGNVTVDGSISVPTLSVSDITSTGGVYLDTDTDDTTTDAFFSVRHGSALTPALTYSVDANTVLFNKVYPFIESNNSLYVTIDEDNDTAGATFEVWDNNGVQTSLFSVAKTGVSTLNSFTAGGAIQASYGDITAGLNSGSSRYININAAAGSIRKLRAQTNGVTRWTWGVNTTAESGADAGGNFVMDAFTDAGVFIDQPLIINRVAGGAMTLGRPVTMLDDLGVNGGDFTSTAASFTILPTPTTITMGAEADALTMGSGDSGSWTSILSHNTQIRADTGLVSNFNVGSVSDDSAGLLSLGSDGTTGGGAADFYNGGGVDTVTGRWRLWSDTEGDFVMRSGPGGSGPEEDIISIEQATTHNVTIGTGLTVTEGINATNIGAATPGTGSFSWITALSTLNVDGTGRFGVADTAIGQVSLMGGATTAGARLYLYSGHDVDTETDSWLVYSSSNGDLDFDGIGGTLATSTYMRVARATRAVSILTSLGVTNGITAGGDLTLGSNSVVLSQAALSGAKINIGTQAAVAIVGTDNARVQLTDSGGTADKKVFEMFLDGATTYFRSRTDTGAVNTTAMSIDNTPGAADVTFPYDIFVNGGDFKSTASSFTMLPTPTTITMGAEADTLNMGSGDGGSVINLYADYFKLRADSGTVHFFAGLGTTEQGEILVGGNSTTGGGNLLLYNGGSNIAQPYWTIAANSTGQFEISGVSGGAVFTIDDTADNFTMANATDSVGTLLTLDDNTLAGTNAFINFAGVSGSDATSSISLRTTSGAVVGHIQVKINGTKRWIAITADPS